MRTRTVRAIHLLVGDELISADPVAVPDGGARVAALVCPDGQTMEVWTDANLDPMGPPDVILSAYDSVEIRQEGNA